MICLFSVLLLLLTGTVFVNSPAALIADITPGPLNEIFWITVILLYYVMATLLPIYFSKARKPDQKQKNIKELLG